MTAKVLAITFTVSYCACAHGKYDWYIQSTSVNSDVLVYVCSAYYWSPCNFTAGINEYADSIHAEVSGDHGVSRNDVNALYSRPTSSYDHFLCLFARLANQFRPLSTRLDCFLLCHFPPFVWVGLSFIAHACIVNEQDPPLFYTPPWQSLL